MFVVQLIGRQANTVIEMPFDVARSCLSMGTVRQATDDEISAAGLQVLPKDTDADPDAFPEGYSFKIDDAGGYNVIGPDGDQINEQPFRNLPAARSAAVEAAEAAGEQGKVEVVEIPADWRSMHHQKIIALAKALGSDVSTKVDAIAAVEAAEAAAKINAEAAGT